MILGEIAAKAVVQPARKAAGGSRGTARCGVAQQRGVNHRACNRQLGLVSLQLRILNGVVSLLTTEVHNKALAQYLIQQSGAIGSLDLTTATLEVLACIALKLLRIYLVFDLSCRAVMQYIWQDSPDAYASRTLSNPGYRSWLELGGSGCDSRRQDDF